MTTHAAVHKQHSELNHEIAWWQSNRAQQVATITLAVMAFSVGVWWFGFHPFISTDDARVSATLVRVAPSGVSGRVISVNVEEGSIVKKDQVLVELDHRLPQAQFERAKAKADLANRELDRIHQLVVQHGLPPRDLDNAKANAETANAELQIAQVNLENTFLRSPFDGIVVQKTAEVGNIIEPSQTAVTVADMEHAWIAANIEETSVAAIKSGQPVTISIDEGGRLDGHVSEVRAATASEFALIPSDNGTGNYTKVVQRIPIKVAIDSKPLHPLRVGQSVEIRIRVR